MKGKKPKIKLIPPDPEQCQADAGERGVGHGVAEERHPVPDDQRADHPAGEADEDDRQERVEVEGHYTEPAGEVEQELVERIEHGRPRDGAAASQQSWYAREA